MVLQWILGTLLFLLFSLVITWCVVRPRHLVIALQCVGELLRYAGGASIDASSSLDAALTALAKEWRARRAADRGR